MKWSNPSFVSELDEQVLLLSTEAVEEFTSSDEVPPHTLSGVLIGSVQKFMLMNAPSVKISRGIHLHSDLRPRCALGVPSSRENFISVTTISGLNFKINSVYHHLHINIPYTLFLTETQITRISLVIFSFQVTNSSYSFVSMETFVPIFGTTSFAQDIHKLNKVELLLSDRSYITILIHVTLSL